MRNLLWLTSVLWALVPARQVLAELPPLSAAELQQQASHVVRGKVVQVYSAEKEPRPGFSDRLFAIELNISQTSKGEGLAPEQTIFIRTWQAAIRPRGWVGPGGQSRIPRQGEDVTVYVRGEQGAYDALIPNGISAN